MELIINIRTEFDVGNLIIDCTLQNGTSIRLLDANFLFIEQVYRLRLPINSGDETRRFGIIANGNILKGDNNKVAHNILLEKDQNRLFIIGVDEMNVHLNKI